jgi:hypothetical protein
MNLKAAQILFDTQFAARKPRIYATGVHLVPMKISIQRIEHYVWVADEFNDDSFDNEGKTINPHIVACEIEKMYEKS